LLGCTRQRSDPNGWRVATPPNSNINDQQVTVVRPLPGTDAILRDLTSNHVF
jgi:hypothetical protein